MNLTESLNFQFSFYFFFSEAEKLAFPFCVCNWDESQPEIWFFFFCREKLGKFVDDSYWSLLLSIVHMHIPFFSGQPHMHVSKFQLMLGQVLWCTKLTMMHHTLDFTHIRQMWLNTLLDGAKLIWKDYCIYIRSFYQTHLCSRLVHTISGMVHLQALRRTLPQPTTRTCRQHSPTRCCISATPQARNQAPQLRVDCLLKHDGFKVKLLSSQCQRLDSKLCQQRRQGTMLT